MTDKHHLIDTAIWGKAENKTTKENKPFKKAERSAVGDYVHMGLTLHAIYIMNALRQTDLIMRSPSSESGFLKDSDNPERDDDIGVESGY